MKIAHKSRMLSSYRFVIIMYYEAQLALPRHLRINVRQEPFVARNDLLKCLYFYSAASCCWVEVELVDAFSKESCKAPSANFIRHLAGAAFSTAAIVEDATGTLPVLDLRLRAVRDRPWRQTRGYGIAPDMSATSTQYAILSQQAQSARESRSLLGPHRANGKSARQYQPTQSAS
jgi:hypothetical protein